MGFEFELADVVKKGRLERKFTVPGSQPRRSQPAGDSRPDSKGEAQVGDWGEGAWRPQSSSVSLTGLSAPWSSGANSYRKHPLNHSFNRGLTPGPAFLTSP